MSQRYYGTLATRLDIGHRHIHFYTWKDSAIKRQSLKFDIVESSSREWGKYSKFHYLSSQINKAGKCYEVKNEQGEGIAFISVIHFPHPKKKNIKKIHRLVVLPDYQGIGIGAKLLETVAKIYKDKGFDVGITTSHIGLIGYLKNKRKYKRNDSLLSRTGQLGKNRLCGFRKSCSFYYR